MFLVNDTLIWRDKQVTVALELYGAPDARAFYACRSFYEFETSFSEDNMPECALDIFIENATKMVKVILLNAKNDDQTLRQHLGPNIAFS